MSARVVGTLAIFRSPEDLEAAVSLVSAAGIERFDPLTPFAVERIFQSIPRERDHSWAKFFFPRLNVLGTIALAAGLSGMAGGFGLQWLAHSWALPMNAGGRPLFSWPNYIPITFVFSILAAAGAVFLAFLLLLRLPEPYHPAFHSPRFNLGEDLFYLFVPAQDPQREAAPLAAIRDKIPTAILEEVRG